jgi:hypothetical protein
VVDWDGSKYKLVPMTPKPPVLPTRGIKPALVTERETWYMKQVRLPDAVTGATSTQPLIGYQVGAFAFDDSPAVRLLTGYLAGTPNRQSTQLYELRANQISLSNFHLEACYYGDPSCRAPREEYDVIVPPDKFPDNALLAGWKEAKSQWTPTVTVAVTGRQDCPSCS